MSEVTKKERMAYIGIKPCGCAIWASLDEPENISLRTENARMMQELILEGYTIEHVTTEVARQRWGGCTHEPVPAPAPQEGRDNEK